MIKTMKKNFVHKSEVAIFEKSSAPSDSSKHDVLRKRDHDDHLGDTDLTKGEKGSMSQKTSGGSKSKKTTSSSQQPAKEYQSTSSTQQQHELDGWSDILEIDEYEIVFESREEDLIPENVPPVFFGPQRDSNAPARYLYNKDMFYLKNRNPEDKNYMLSLHKIHATTFLEDDIEECLIRWEIPKFYDATLKRVMMKIEVIVYANGCKFKDPPLGELDRDIMELFITEIKKDLTHRFQMRRWESYEIRRPILYYSKRPE
ncbi:hypothetical protein Tco_1385712 [Tanacetum coccineum]